MVDSISSQSPTMLQMKNMELKKQNKKQNY